MQIFSYQKNGEILMNLEEVTLQCSQKELEKIIRFLSETLQAHASVEDKTKMCHSHLRDWDTDWKTDELDLIVVTTQGGREK